MAGSKGTKAGGSSTKTGGSTSTKTGGSTSMKTGGSSTKTGGSTSTKTGTNAKVSTSKGPGLSSGTKIGAPKDHGSAGKVMKAPGQDGFIFRQAFESDPKSYFQGLRD